MSPSIQLYVQIAILCCVVTTSMGGIADWQKEFSRLENKVKLQQEDIDSFRQIIAQMEKRLQQLESNGEFINEA